MSSNINDVLNISRKWEITKIFQNHLFGKQMTRGSQLFSEDWERFGGAA
jgi:hypothetical protein